MEHFNEYLRKLNLLTYLKVCSTKRNKLYFGLSIIYFALFRTTGLCLNIIIADFKNIAFFPSFLPWIIFLFLFDYQQITFQNSVCVETLTKC